MVSWGIIMANMSLEELVSRAKEFFEGLESNEVKELTRNDFIKTIGIDPLDISSSYKRELAKILYYEFKVPYRKICELLAMSMRDVSRAIRGGASSKKAAKRSRVTEVNVELQAKAIELVRSGEARNPNDLVLKLKIPLESTEQLFNKIVENESITTTLVLEAVRRLDERIEKAESIDIKLGELVERAEPLAEKLEKYNKELKKQGVKLEKLPDLLSLTKHLEEELRGLENRVTSLAKSIEEISNRNTQLEKKYSDLSGELEKVKGDIRRLNVRLDLISAIIKLKYKNLHSWVEELITSGQLSRSTSSIHKR